jgi:hypothetical protein
MAYQTLPQSQTQFVEPLFYFVSELTALDRKANQFTMGKEKIHISLVVIGHVDAGE